MTSSSVWTWLPQHHAPVRCGVFALERGVGTFAYDGEYRQRADAVALDPVNLPFTRSQRPAKETRQNGLFGVFRDASPEGFGLAMLEAMHHKSLASPLDRLEASVGDAVGAIEVCDDIERKLRWDAPSSEDLVAALRDLAPEQSPTAAARAVVKVQGTSLGGERPKLTVRHDGQLWIAKLQLRGDAPHAPLREYAAMQCAAAAGVEVAETRFVRAGSRELLLVRRFDRHIGGDGHFRRRLYASAHTVLRLDAADMRGDPRRSYVALCHELRRWCARADAPVLEQQRELYRRMVVNAVCGNGDDHPRNHGLVLVDDRWRLSPAFDIAPHIVFSETLAMSVNRRGDSAVRASALLQDCESFGYSREEALALIDASMAAVARRWPQALQEAGFPADILPAPASARWIKLDEALAEPPPRGRRLRSG
ncbi:type II toxin-antitoxin system HipA family toxin [Ramlibacter sp.]|uniref:type II toxin-antitoxin system HipA family toxin n=1 Tax=Ramlibacter sp. TaxID=1917967 RepID=UPI003D0DA516